MLFSLSVDDAPTLTSAIYGSEAFLRYSSLHLGTVAAPGNRLPSSIPDFEGDIQQAS